MKKIHECRACGSKALTNAFAVDTGVRSGGVFDRSRKENFLLCDPSRHARACGLLQSENATPVSEISMSGRHISNRDQLRIAATEALELISGRDCAALDIGCNDGSLLSYYPRWVERYGVDTSHYIDDIGSWASTIKGSFPSVLFDEKIGERKFDIITAISTFEYINEPAAFLSAVKDRLVADGVFVLETLYSPIVLTQNVIDTFQQGVSAVYSIGVLEWLVRSADMKVVKGTLTPKDGGSIRLFITHKDNDALDFDPWTERLARLWDEENALAMRAMQPYQTFSTRVDEVREEFQALIKDINARGETIHLLGADRHAQVMLDWMGDDATAVRAITDTQRLREAHDENEFAVPIVTEAETRAAEPDYLIAPARLKRETLDRWREAIMLGAKLIFVTPRPHVVNAANYTSEYGKVIAGGDRGSSIESLRSILAAVGGPRLVAENDQQSKSA